jgi:hypothetical protein
MKYPCGGDGRDVRVQNKLIKAESFCQGKIKRALKTAVRSLDYTPAYRRQGIQKEDYRDSWTSSEISAGSLIFSHHVGHGLLQPIEG